MTNPRPDTRQARISAAEVAIARCARVLNRKNLSAALRAKTLTELETARQRLKEAKEDGHSDGA